MTLRVLTVDDWQHRHDRIASELRRAGFGFEVRQRSGPAAVTDDDLAWARLVFLDHDMCQRQFTEAGGLLGGLFVPDDSRPCPSPVGQHCGCPTGTDLVRRMVAAPWRPAVLVHTANNVAGPIMVAELASAGFVVAALSASRWAWFDWRLVVRRVLEAGRGT